MSIDLAAALARVPELAGADPTGARRLGGLTNVNHLVEHGGARYVVRIPGDGTGEYVDRAAEAVAARIAADAGVGAPVVFFDVADGLMVTRYVDDTTTMDPARFADPGAAARAGRALRRLHDHPERFAVDFRLFPMIDEYKALLAAKGAPLPDGYDEVQGQAGAARAALEAHPVATVPSHCDPLCENFLDDGVRMWVIDYEYAGNNDPMWDLGDLAVEAGFDVEQEAVLLTAYVGGEPNADQAGRVVVYRALCDLLWTLWGVIQHVDGNQADDFWAYALGRFDRCRHLMASPRFAAAVDAIG